MSFLNVKNNAASKLAAAISDSASSLTVLTGEGARFPASNFHITIDDEILLCSSRTNDVLTVTRAQEDTDAAAHGKDAAVRLNITAAIIEQLQELSKIIWKDTWASHEFPNIETTIDWSDLDLTADTSPNAKFAIMACQIYIETLGGAGECAIFVRKNGATAYAGGKAYSWMAQTDFVFFPIGIIGLDSGQVVEKIISITAGQGWKIDVYVYVLGYIE